MFCGLFYDVIVGKLHSSEMQDDLWLGGRCLEVIMAQ
jgi:hypothetical protein